MSPVARQTQESTSPRPVRKVRACTGCRSLKIKCRMPQHGPPCARCQSRTLQCRVDRNPQSLLDESDKWRRTVSGNVSQLQTAVNVLLRMAELPALASYDRSDNDQTPAAAAADESDALMQPAPIATAADEVETDIYGSPINSLYQLTRMPSTDGGSNGAVSQDIEPANDFISRGCIGENAARHLFRRFVDRFDHFCYGIICPHETLDSLRRSSTLLTAAVCTVGALHEAERSTDFTVCHKELLRLLSTRMLTYRYSVDDIRALLVASYWLGNISYTLIGHAIRTATILNYHQAYFMAIKGDQRSFERARLWYVLYIMDHHSSILYSRPALISANQEPHQQWERFISSEHGGEPDVRMSSQVALYHIIAKVKDVFGSQSAQLLPDHCLYQLRGYFSDLDRWYMAWGNRMKTNPYVGNFPVDGAILHYHFARLHMCSYIFRGITSQTAQNVSDQVREYASLAVTSATAVLELVLERDDLRNALVGMPVYFHGMITFAAVFLIKAATTNFLGLTTVDADAAFALLDRCVRELRSQRAARQHLIYHISRGLEEMMARARPTMNENGESGGITATQEEVAAIDSLFALDTFDLLRYPLEYNEDVLANGDYQWAV
ncbi:hypothetical protein ASPVEDRAFT_204662 [Aspergillus versicolor CBS 583.65]|uniref:Zn(2)-C6 fungal-type domain-containing protein n=1 Tax=Aspergillus versicolor CBS 583.65 TaxID=1036611 RepID=A0A1L9Q555_ASPVE|nr:uncharacterized protein ASPVEDRAFT_204662 [Aspergillus versicolor CBS 583.65]OJJ08818.1 hypothetical protein ASPVEDRAFT_204662 [Aspergillus versicolor CBS 583.65]